MFHTGPGETLQLLVLTVSQCAIYLYFQVSDDFDMDETQTTAWKFINANVGTLEIDKDDGGIAGFRIGFQKAVEKTSGKIFALIKENNCVTIPELAEKIGVTERTVERNLQKS